MNESAATSEYLVLSRGQWDKNRSPEEIQRAIDAFYAWHERLVAEGRMLPGQRLARETKLVSKDRVMDGPFSEAKEVIGGYWTIRAASLEEAAKAGGGEPLPGLRPDLRDPAH